MTFFYFVTESRNGFIPIEMYFGFPIFVGAIYPYIFLKFGLKKLEVIFLGGVISTLICLVSNFMYSRDSFGIITAGAMALIYLMLFIPPYLVSMLWLNGKYKQ
jgi:hypothetical protein